MEIVKFVLTVGGATLITFIALATLGFLLSAYIIIRRGGDPFKDAL